MGDHRRSAPPWVILLGLLAPTAAMAQDVATPRTASIIYLGRDWLFINAGWEAGLRQGSEVEVVRRGRSIAVLRVESVGDRRASCAVVSREVPLMLGDSVRLEPAAPRPPVAVALVAPAPPPAPPPAPAPAPVQAAPMRRDTSSSPGRATVSFVTSAEIYVSAGRQEGLTEGAQVSVVRRDSVVATLRVKYLASHQSSCEVVRSTRTIVVGDVVRFVPVPSPANATAAVASATRSRRHRRLSGPGIHGRFGLRYLRATSALSGDSSIAGARTGFNQPSFDLRLNGLSVGGTAMGLAIDLRTRYTVTSSTGQPNRVDGKTRVYQAALFWGAPGAGFRTVAGRQFLTAVTSVSMFDGGLMEVNGARMTLGLFGGVEPDAASLGFSNDIQDYGGYIQFHSRPASVSSWAVTTGAVGSLQANHANREFGFIQLSMNHPSYSIFGLQEIDYYPPWKVQLGEQPLSFTSQYLTGLFRASTWLAFNASYDNRRSVRLYRDTQNPETAFDDAYRQGLGAGLQLSSYKVRVGGDWRRSTGGMAGRANSSTGTLGLDPVTPLKVALSARATWYQNETDSTVATPVAQRIAGRLYSWWLGCDPVDRLHVDVNGGIRREDNRITTTTQTSTWYGVAADASIGRAWFVSLSGLRQRDPANPGSNITTQLYGSVTWRF